MSGGENLQADEAAPVPGDSVRSYTRYALRRYEYSHAQLYRDAGGIEGAQQQTHLFLDDLQRFVLLSFVQAVWQVDKHLFNKDFQAVMEKLIAADASS